MTGFAVELRPPILPRFDIRPYARHTVIKLERVLGQSTITLGGRAGVEMEGWDTDATRQTFKDKDQRLLARTYRQTL